MTTINRLGRAKSRDQPLIATKKKSASALSFAGRLNSTTGGRQGGAQTHTNAIPAQNSSIAHSAATEGDSKEVRGGRNNKKNNAKPIFNKVRHLRVTNPRLYFFWSHAPNKHTNVPPQAWPAPTFPRAESLSTCSTRSKPRPTPGARSIAPVDPAGKNCKHNNTVDASRS